MENRELDHIIEKSFSTEPDFKLTDNFANKITLKVMRREQWKTDLQEYLYLTTILILLISVASIIYYFADKNIVMRFYASVKENILHVVFIAIILNFILFADRVLLRFLFRRWNRT